MPNCILSSSTGEKIKTLVTTPCTYTHANSCLLNSSYSGNFDFLGDKIRPNVVLPILFLNEQMKRLAVGTGTEFLRAFRFFGNLIR